MTLEVGERYRAIGPDPEKGGKWAAPEVEVVSDEGDFYAVKSLNGAQPSKVRIGGKDYGVIRKGCEHFWRSLDAPASDTRSDTGAPEQASLLAPWWQRRMCTFDLETTSPLPEEARTVTAAIAYVGGGEETEAKTWLADPGVEIPAEATAIHGITTEYAREHGRPVAEVTAEVIAELMLAMQQRMALVIFNSRYDLTVEDRECRRYGLVLPDWSLLRVVDPSVLDKFLDQYRKSFPNGEHEGAISTRKLEGMCGVYGATLDGAHDATFDAIAAGRLAYAMGKRGVVVRRKRWEQQQLQPQWLAVKDDLDALHDFQRELALAERERFAEYKRSIGEDELAARIELELDWPVLELMPHEAIA